MSDDLKFIVQGVNGLLSKNFNLITFNALNPEDLLQVNFIVDEWLHGCVWNFNKINLHFYTH